MGYIFTKFLLLINYFFTKNTQITIKIFIITIIIKGKTKMYKTWNLIPVYNFIIFMKFIKI